MRYLESTRPPIDWLKCVKLEKDGIKIRIKYNISMSMEDARIDFFKTLRQMLLEIEEKAEKDNCSEILEVLKRYNVYFMDSDSFPNVHLQAPDMLNHS
jgi:hypothetical protein